ncbi:MAG: HEAT repeat domain-containing protein, partial [Solirubrobacterales bacterium]
MSERDDERRVVLADPDSLLGMLQRGRGKGFLMALERPPQEVWPLLLECITNDPRLDTQCEDRAEYYASLILRTGMDLEAIHSLVKRDDDSTNGLVLSTLESLAERGSHRATEILREYLVYGREVMWIARVLAKLPVQGAMEGIDEVLCRRVSDDPQLYEEFKSDVEWSWELYCRDDEDDRKTGGYLLPVCEPWKSLCRKHAGLAELFSRVGLPYDDPTSERKVTDADVEELSVEELLSTVDKARFYPSRRALIERVSVEDEDHLLQSLSSDNKYRVMLAFCGLGELGTPKAFEAVKSYIEGSEEADSSVRRRAFHAIEQMPGSLTLETARQWFRSKEWRFQIAAGDILENHATPEDIPLLIEALRTPETLRREDFRLSSAVNAMARFEGIGPVPELEQIFREAQSCFDRYRAADAMAATSPVHFTAEYAFECLWDCHWDTPELGCEMVSLSMNDALDRLRELAADAN